MYLQVKETYTMAETNELTLDVVKAFLDSNDEAKKYLQSIKDNAVSRGILTFEQNFMKDKFPKILDDEVNKRLPVPETPEQKRLKELELKFTQADADKNRAILQSKLLQRANEKNLPTFLTEYSFDEDEEKSYTKLETLGQKYIAQVNAEVEARLSGNGRKAPINNENKIENVTIDNIKGKSFDDLMKNKDAIEALLKQDNK
jgi:hypothetical protein